MSDSPLRLDFVFPRFKVLSGAERLVLELTGALARAGHRPRIVCHSFDRSCRPLLAEGVALAETGLRLDWFRNRYLNAMFDYARATALRRALDPGADATILYGPALRLAPRLRRAGRTTVYHCFEPPRALYQDRDAVLRRAGVARWLLAPALSLYRRYDRRLVRTPGALMASGPFAAERVREIYGREAIPVTHGIDRRRLDESSAAVAATTFVTVNYLHPRKRVDLAIRALAHLREPVDGEHWPPTLRVVGAGPELETLATLAQELGVDARVTFSGFVPDADLGAHYHASRCYLHTAHDESFGLSVIEAAYCGLPVIAVAEGGVVDNVLDGRTGLLCAATPEAIARAAEKLLGDADAAAAAGQAGRELVVERYRWERGAADLLSAVRDAQ